MRFMATIGVVLGWVWASATATAAPVLSGWLSAPAETIESLVPKLVDGQLLLVEVSADWCAPCHQLQSEVLETERAAEILAGDRGLVVDFESPYGQLVKRARGVMSLPTMLVIDREGVEIGRIEGYPGRTEFVEAVRDAKAGRFGLRALEAQVKARPADFGLSIELAQARLVRGFEADALAALEAIVQAAPIDVAAHAARVKGRWLLRVKDDAPAALEFYGRMLEKFAGSKHAPHFTYWTASAYEAAGDRRAALALFEAWAREAPGAKEPLEMQADFMVHFGFPVLECERVVRAALAANTDSAELEYLLARVLNKRGELGGADEAIARAVAREPETALYRNFQARLKAKHAEADAP